MDMMLCKYAAIDSDVLIHCDSIAVVDVRGHVQDLYVNV